jgi:cation diffusion facilitator family transporter
VSGTAAVRGWLSRTRSAGAWPTAGAGRPGRVSAVHPPRAAEGEESTASVLAALAANTTIAISKGAAAALTGSPALFAETLHTVADTANEAILFLAVRSSRRPADAIHPLGYGPDRYFWALIAAIGMFVIGGAVSVWEGIQALLDPPELDAFWVGVAVLVTALVLDSASRFVALRQLRRQATRRGIDVRRLLAESADPTVVTIYFEDTVDVLGAFLALMALILHRVTGSGVPDAIVTVLIGVLLTYVAVRLARRNRHLLANQAVPERYVVWLREELAAEPGIAGVARIDAVYLGVGEVLVVADVHVTPGLSAEQVSGTILRAQDRIRAEVPAIVRIALTPTGVEAETPRYGRRGLPEAP